MLRVFEDFHSLDMVRGIAGFIFEGGLYGYQLVLAMESPAVPLVTNSDASLVQPRLAPGFYTGAFGRAAGLRVPAPLLQANTLTCGGTGAFKIHEVEYDAAGSITKLAADFAQDCLGYGVVASGAVRHHSTIPLALDELYVDPGRDRDVIEGDPVALDATVTWSPVSPVVGRRWQQISGPTFDLAACSADAPICRTYAPQVAKGGATAVFELQATTESGKVATAQLTLRVRSLADRQTLIQIFGSTHSSTFTGVDSRFMVPVKDGTEAIYPAQRPERIELLLHGNNNNGAGSPNIFSFSINNPQAQPLVAPIDQQMVGVDTGLLVDVPSAGYAFDAPAGCVHPIYTAVIPTMERDAADLTRVYRLGAWLGQICAGADETYARFWIDYEPTNPPHALAGGPTTVKRGESFRLYDAGSTAPAGSITVQSWRQVLGPLVRDMVVSSDGSMQATPDLNSPDGTKLVFVTQVVDNLGQPGIAVWAVVVNGGTAPTGVAMVSMSTKRDSVVAATRASVVQAIGDLAAEPGSFLRAGGR
jgi:hypothetical protein